MVFEKLRRIYESRFKESMKEKGINIKELSALSGIKEITLEAYRRMKIVPSEERKKIIAKILGRDVSYLFPSRSLNFLKKRSRRIEQNRGLMFSVESYENPVESYTKRELREYITRILDDIKKGEIVKERYGLVDGIEKSLRELGNKKGVSGERIRQIEEDRIEELRRRYGRRLEHFLLEK